MYKPTIGLEIHVELKTRTKMFCDSLNDPDEKHPNVNICPICVGHPGTLPVINKTAVEAVLKVGMALNGDIPQFSKFDRKNYFYPDLPKGYQISQYDMPLILGGVLNGVRLRRIHLEEDTGRLMHEHRTSNIEHRTSLVDFNRAGVPLMELVSEPDIAGAEQAVEFAKELQLILRYLGTSDANIEKGEMRIEANVSLSTSNVEHRTLNVLGTKVEVKNMGSFRAVKDAIEYEIKRQAELLESGKKVVQETRGWDEEKKKTIPQRLKEEAHDYRYFPEPNLPLLDLSGWDLRRIKIEVPELPREKRSRFVKEYNLTPDQVEILIADRESAKYFEEATTELFADLTRLPALPTGQAGGRQGLNADERGKIQPTKLLFNYLTTDLRGLMLEQGIDFANLKISPENFADLVEMIYNGEVSSRTAKDLLQRMFESGVDPHQVLRQEGLTQVSDEEKLKTLALKVIEAHPRAVEDFKKGKENALQFLVGKAMAELRGSGNPEKLQKIFREHLARRDG